MYQVPVEELLRNALFQLMEKRSIEKITLSDILREAKVSKSTFYRHFRDKYELMDSCYETAIRSSLTNLRHDNWNDILYDFFRFFDENRAFLLNGFRGEGPDSLRHFIYTYTCEFYEDQVRQRTETSRISPEMQLAIYFNTAGSLQLLELWLLNPEKYDLSVYEISQLHYRFMPEPLKSLFPQSESET